MNLVEKLWWPKFGDNVSLCLHNITIDIFIEPTFECVLYRYPLLYFKDFSSTFRQSIKNNNLEEVFIAIICIEWYYECRYKYIK